MDGLARRCEKHTTSPNSFNRGAGASSRAMVEFYEDFCNNGGTIFPTTMPGDAPDLVIGLAQSIHHHKGYDATGLTSETSGATAYRCDQAPVTSIRKQTS